MVFLPKKAVGSTPDGMEIFTPENTRPLSIANTDNRLICSAVRLHVEPIAAPGIVDEQRGFIKGRSMLSNVLDVDEDMMCAAMACDQSCAIFFDFRAAFPSVAHEFILGVLRARGWPSWMLNFMQRVYSRNYCFLSTGGMLGAGFTIESGVRQGCPLSPLIFSIISDVLLRRLRRADPVMTIRAYADDLAVVLHSGLVILGTLQEVFEEYAAISGLHLHPSKSTFVPLSDIPHQDFRANVAAVAPLWAGFTISDHTTYLGFSLGPKRGEHSWDKPLIKMLDRAKLWRSIGGGQLATLQAYKMYILSVASFILQLEELPSNWEVFENRLISLLFPGPRCWAPPAILHNLKELGSQYELPNAHAVSFAAKLRVHRWEAVGTGGLQIDKRARSLRQRIARMDCLFRAARLRDWFDRSPILRLADTRCKAGDIAAQRGPSLQAHFRDSSGNPTEKKAWQKRALLLYSSPDKLKVDILMRRKLDAWRAATLPGHRVKRARGRLSMLGKSAPPRVWAAVFRTYLRGWICARSFGARVPCRFGCNAGEDDMDHIPHCRIVLGLIRRHFSIDLTVHSNRVDAFLLFTVPPEEALDGAKAIYCTYRAHNAVRHGGGSAAEIFAQAAKEL